MNVFVTLVNGRLDVCILADEICKSQTPDAPIATQLHNDVFILYEGLGYGLVNLCDGVDFLVVNLGKLCLCLHAEGCKGKKEDENGLFHVCLYFSCCFSYS